MNILWMKRATPKWKKRLSLVMDTEPLTTQTTDEMMWNWVRKTGKLLAENGTEDKWKYYLKVALQIEKQTN